MANEHNDSLAAINAALEQKKQEKTALVEQQVSEQIAKIVKEGTLLEGMDLNKAKRLVNASPAVEQAALEVIQTLIANPKANKDSIITKIATKYKTTADKVEQLFNALSMFNDKDVEESTSIEEAATSYSNETPYGLRHKEFTGKEQRLQTKETWHKSDEARTKFIDKLQNKDGFLEVESFHDPKNESTNDIDWEQINEANETSDSGKIRDILQKHLGVESKRGDNFYTDSGKSGRRFKITYLRTPVTDEEHQKISSDLKDTFGDRLINSKPVSRESFPHFLDRDKIFHSYRVHLKHPNVNESDLDEESDDNIKLEQINEANETSDSDDIKDTLEKHLQVAAGHKNFYKDSRKSSIRFKMSYLDKPVTDEQHRNIHAELKSKFGDRLVKTEPIVSKSYSPMGPGKTYHYHGYAVHLKHPNVNESDLDEVLRVEDGADKWIHDFVHSDNPKFEGKTKEERKDMALGAFYAAKKKNDSEEIDESTKVSIKNIRSILGKESFNHVPGDNTEYVWSDLSTTKIAQNKEKLLTLGFKKVTHIVGFQSGELGTLQLGNEWAAFINEDSIVIVDLSEEIDESTKDKEFVQGELNKQWKRSGYSGNVKVLHASHRGGNNYNMVSKDDEENNYMVHSLTIDKDSVKGYHMPVSTHDSIVDAKNAMNKNIKESINEDWLPLARVHPKDVEKVRTKKSGQNYLRVVSFDQKSKEFEVVTPKQYEEGNTDNPITVSFSDVVMVSTDDMPEDGEKHSTKNTSGITKHNAKYSDDDEQDESSVEVFTDEELDEELINESVQLDTARAFAASNKAGKNGSAANHKRAADLHRVAEKKHRETVVRWKDEYNNPTSSPDNKSLSKTLMKIHQKWADTHADKARYHDKAGTE